MKIANQIEVQLRVLAGIVCGLAFVLQLLYLSQSFDAYQLVQYSEELSWRSIFGYLGKLAKLAVLFGFLLGLALYRDISRYYHNLFERWSWQRYAVMLPLQIAAFSLVYFLSSQIFDADDLHSVPVQTLSMWAVAATFWVLATVFALISVKSLRQFLGEKRALLILISCLALTIWWLTGQTAQLWGPLSYYTFSLAVNLMLVLSNDYVYVDYEQKVLGLEEFAVNIAPACSGYEGIGLVCSFIAVYLYIHKHEFKFPQSLLLFPIGAILIWLLNVLRIVLLILIGEHWSPEVAIGGFHSQAGWLTFILASLAMLWLASSVPYFAHLRGRDTGAESSVASVSSEPAAKHRVGDPDLAIATLLPMVALLAIILLTSVLSAGFDWLYPARVVVVFALLLWLWPKYKLPRLKLERSHVLKSAEALFFGAVIALLWWAMLTGRGAEQDELISSTLSEAGFGLAAVWLVFRFVGTALTVPIAEELAFRSYLLHKLSAVPVALGGKIPVSVMAIAVSSLAFGFLHGAWFAGTVAGVLYALVRYRTGHVVYAVLAHGFTNALLFAYACISGEWSLL